MIQLSKLALHCTCNLRSVCIVLVTGSDCMNDDESMTDDSDESVSGYKNTPITKKMLYIVLNQKILLLL